LKLSHHPLDKLLDVKEVDEENRSRWRGGNFWKIETDHFSRASGSTVWFVYASVL
jgi:hypothetical protein